MSDAKDNRFYREPACTPVGEMSLEKQLLMLMHVGHDPRLALPPHDEGFNAGVRECLKLVRRAAESETSTPELTDEEVNLIAQEFTRDCPPGLHLDAVIRRVHKGLIALRRKS